MEQSPEVTALKAELQKTLEHLQAIKGSLSQLSTEDWKSAQEVLRKRDSHESL